MAGADEAELREVLREWEEKRNPVKLLSFERIKTELNRVPL